MTTLRRVATLFFNLIAACALHTPATALGQSTETAPVLRESVVETIAPKPDMPSWFVDAKPSSDVWVALDTLANAASQGLNPQDYRTQALARGFLQAAENGATPDTEAQLNADLSAALEHYLLDMNHGRLSPETLKHRFKAPRTERFDAYNYLVQARLSGRLSDALAEAQPKIPMYEAIRSTMLEYQAMSDHPAWNTPLPSLPARSLKPGESYEGLALIAARLAALGDLPADFVPGERYDNELVFAVIQFQTRHGLEADGLIGPATLEQLNVSPAQRVEQMALTLERLRWTPLLYGPRMIVVNVPEFVLRAYEQQGERIELDLEMRVIVGRALDTRTPIFLEDMRFIEFSPYWNVPSSIARGETLPRLRRDPAYFAQQGFEFVSKDGSVITTLSGEAIDAVQRGEWRIRQRPGPSNALGDIKFIFPNDQNIYLHHTPAPQLFSRSRRDFSHGCIRIEQPVELASFVLQNQAGWDTARIEQAMSRGTSRTLRLDEPIPVLITYSTVVVKDGGKVYFFPDIYQQDARLNQALRSARPS